MDELVRKALARWPDVPDCTGWLALDARGRWRVGEGTDAPRQTITHAAMIAFINRNYLSAGRHWFFQNGPQRVFVELEYTPFVWRLMPGAEGRWDLVGHTGHRGVPTSVWLDEAGRFLIEARGAGGEPRIGVVHDHDTSLVAELLCGENGDALGDDALSVLAQASTEASAETTPRVHLQWAAADGPPLLLPLHRIASTMVPAHFGFEPRPSVGLRVDVDTRR